MNADVASLWQELQTILHDRGELSFQHDVFTPGEIADAVCRASGDPRVHRFVWEYYYPQRYGQTAGRLSDAEAAALIESLRRHPEPPGSPAEAAPQVPTCGLCRRHPVRNAS